MSSHVSSTGENEPLESRQSSKAPDPSTEIRNNNLPPSAIAADIRVEEERTPGMTKESTVWDVYNNEARKVDSELVKDWTASLNFLLVFAAIFAAVLTAFIIESKKILEQDPTEILVDIAIQYLNNIGNQSRSNLTRPDFEPSFEAVSIDCLLFASLGASLVAALASVVALQWVADYDAAITRGGSSPLDRAKRRQFRFAGVTRWKMGELIAALPLLLYSSVVLFWAGAIQWMWTLHYIVGGVVAGGTTTLLGAIYVSSPFRTPLSRGLYWLTQWSLSMMGCFLLWVPIESALRFSSKLYRTMSSHIRPKMTSDTILDDQGISWPSVSSDAMESIQSIQVPPPISPSSSSPAYLPLFQVISEWIKVHLVASGTSRNREDDTAKRDPTLEQEALAWLAQQLPISDDAHERLLLCVSGIPALSTENPSSPLFHAAPWLAILELLSERFLRHILDLTSSWEDRREAGILLQCIDAPFIRRKVLPGASYICDPMLIGYWGQCCPENDGTAHFGEIGSTPMTFLLARDVPVPSLDSAHELEAAWKLIRWRNSIIIGKQHVEEDLFT